MFKRRYPNEGIESSKFADLCPMHCNLAGARVTHSVCVSICQNVKLMMLGVMIHLSKRTIIVYCTSHLQSTAA